MDGYRLVSFENGGGVRAGALIGGQVFDAESLLGGTSVSTASVIDILEDWDTARPALENAAASPPSGGVALESVRLHAPLLYPGTIYFAGANYWDHMREMAASIKEMTGNEPPVEKAEEPWLSIKASRSCVAGPSDPIRLPAFSTMVDWEAEIGVVIGRPAKNLSVDDALSCVAGYVVTNDLSARDFIKREGSPFVYDFLGQKSWDGACPIGPWLTPAEAIADPDDMSIKLWVNGDLKQDSNSSQLIHNFAELVSYLTGRITLQPGDLILSGTPAGVGMPKGTFLNAGDTVRIEIGGCGTMEQTVEKAD